MLHEAGDLLFSFAIVHCRHEAFSRITLGTILKHFDNPVCQIILVLEHSCNHSNDHGLDGRNVSCKQLCFDGWEDMLFESRQCKRVVSSASEGEYFIAVGCRDVDPQLAQQIRHKLHKLITERI